MKRGLGLALLVALLALAGCAPVVVAQRSSPAAVQFWRPAGTQEAWRISGNLESIRETNGWQTTTRRELGISINGQEAIRGPVPENRAVEVGGTFDGRRLTAVCNPERVGFGWAAVNCMILVENERAVTLTFPATPY